MKTRQFALIVLSAILPVVLSPAAGAAGGDSHRRKATPVPEAAARTLELVNRERASAGLPALALDQEVNGIAAGWSPKMADDGALSHNADYLSEASMQRLDATRVGENVAFADSLEEIHSLLMNSPPHRANILHADYRQVGIAAVRTASGSIYLTEDFLTRRTGSAEASPRRSAAKHGKAKKAQAKKPQPKKGRRARTTGRRSGRR